MEKRMDHILVVKGDYGRPRAQEGTTLLFLIVCMAVFAALGTAMLSLFGTAEMSQAFPNQVKRSNYLAESGLRFAFSEVRRLSPPQNVSPVTLADWWTARFNELCNGENLNGKDYTVTAGTNTFNLKMQPYWFKVSTSGANLTSLTATVLGQGLPPSVATGANSFPAGTKIQIGTNSPVPIDASNTTVAANRKSVTFSIPGGVSVPTVPTEAYLVFAPSSNTTVTKGGNLTLGLNTLNVIPPEHGTFLMSGKVYSYDTATAGSTVLKKVNWSGTTSTVDVHTTDDVVFGQNARIVSTGTYTFTGSASQRQISSYVGFASSSMSSYKPPVNNVEVKTTMDDLSSLDLSRSGDRVIVLGYWATGGVHMYWAAFTKLSWAVYRFADPDPPSNMVGYHVAPLSTSLRNTLLTSYTSHGTLSYDVQVKVGWDLNLDYAATGIAFRWHVPDIYDQVNGPRQGYGVTFMRYGCYGSSGPNNCTSCIYPPCGGPFGNSNGDYIPNGAKPDASLINQLIAVLWRQYVDGAGIEHREPLAYAILGDPTTPCDPAAGCLGRTPPDPDRKVTGNQGWPDGRVNDDATIIVRVEDKFISNSQRVNEFKVFWADSSPEAKFPSASATRTKDQYSTNTRRARYCAQWVTDPDCNGNTLFPAYPRNYLAEDATACIAYWTNSSDTTRDYFTLASNVPSGAENAVIWTKLPTAPLDIVLLADRATIRTDKFVLDSFNAYREEVGLTAMGFLGSPNNTVAFDDLSLQILGENE